MGTLSLPTNVKLACCSLSTLTMEVQQGVCTTRQGPEQTLRTLVSSTASQCTLGMGPRSLTSIQVQTESHSHLATSLGESLDPAASTVTPRKPWSIPAYPTPKCLLQSKTLDSVGPTEQAGLTADDHGRVYIIVSGHNAISYVDTLQSQVTEEVNGVPPGGSGPVAPENYWVKTLVRSGLIQHADSAAMQDGWLYLNTNQLELSPSRQYMNVDHRKGPFRSYRTWNGRRPAV
jgi:hypothetical protein